MIDLKKRYLVPIVCFFLPLVFFLFYSIFDSDKVFSDSENRELATMPSISLEKYADASFMQEFETYYNDQFPFRDKFIEVARAYNSLVFPNFLISDEDVVELASKGCIIYKGKIMERFTASKDTIDRYASLVNTLYLECGMPRTFVLVPPPPYELYAPEDRIDEETSYVKAMEILCERLDGPEAVDIEKAFSDNKYDYLFFKTDHHWTQRGAYYAANEFLKLAEGIELEPLDKYKSGKREGFLGSLYKSVMTENAAKILEESPDYVEYFYPFADAKVTAYTSAAMTDPSERQVLYPDYNETTNLYSIYMGGDIALGKIDTDTKNGKSILVVRDSYGHAFIPFLIDAYETIYTVEPRYFNEFNKLELGKFFTENSIDTLLFVGYPQMALGSYWDTMSTYLEYLLNIHE